MKTFARIWLCLVMAICLGMGIYLLTQLPGRDLLWLVGGALFVGTTMLCVAID